jgi:signal transduction histidine kinase
MPSAAMEMVHKSYENIQVCITEIKKLSKKLVIPNLEVGASNAIENLVENLEKGTGLNFKYHVSDHVLTKIDERKQMAFYRITQELLTNIVKHAEAKNVLI